MGSPFGIQVGKGSPFGIQVDKGLFLGRSKSEVVATFMVTAGAVFLVSLMMIKMVPMVVSGAMDELCSLSVAMQVYSFIALCKAIRRSRCADEVSTACIGMYGVAALLRLFSAYQWHNNYTCYVPWHAGSAWIYRLLEFAYVVVAAYAMYLVLAHVRCQYADKGVPTRRYMPLPAIVGVTFVAVMLGIWTKVSCHKFWLQDAAYSIAMWLDAVALLPQLWIVAADNGTDRLTSHFIAGMVVSKVVSGIWWCSFLFKRRVFGRYFACFFGSHLVALVTGADYMYHFFMAKEAHRLEIEEFGHVYRL